MSAVFLTIKRDMGAGRLIVNGHLLEEGETIAGELDMNTKIENLCSELTKRENMHQPFPEEEYARFGDIKEFPVFKMDKAICSEKIRGVGYYVESGETDTIDSAIEKYRFSFNNLVNKHGRGLKMFCWRTKPTLKQRHDPRNKKIWYGIYSRIIMTEETEGNGR